MKTMNLIINDVSFDKVPVEVARSIELMLAPYKATTEEPKAKAEPKPKTEPKKYSKAYTVAKDGKSVTVGTTDGTFLPKPVFRGITYSLKQAGAKWNPKDTAWVFGTKKACAEWCKAQDARA